MDNTPWQARAKAAGLSQRTLARLLGFAEFTISRQLRGLWESGTPQHVKAAVIAWELMTPEQREAWVAGCAEPEGAAQPAPPSPPYLAPRRRGRSTDTT